MAKPTKIHYVTQCAKHGGAVGKAEGKMVKVAKPKHSRDKLGGCPICKAEAKHEQATNQS